jgi:hypothetical protein
VASSSLWYFSICKLYSFRKKLLNLKYVFRFSLQRLSETFLILGRSEREVIKNGYWSSCKEPVILFRFSLALNFLARLSKITHIKFHDNSFVGADLFHSDK